MGIWIILTNVQHVVEASFGVLAWVVGKYIQKNPGTIEN